MATKSRFTFRSLYRDARDLEEQSVWSATPGTDDLAYLQVIFEALTALDPASLLTQAEEEEALAFVRIEYPTIRKVRFEFDSRRVHVDEDMRVVYVDLSGRLWLTDHTGREFTTEEYDYYAAQTAMSLLERRVSRVIGTAIPDQGPAGVRSEG